MRCKIRTNGTSTLEGGLIHSFTSDFYAKYTFLSKLSI